MACPLCYVPWIAGGSFVSSFLAPDPTVRCGVLSGGGVALFTLALTKQRFRRQRGKQALAGGVLLLAVAGFEWMRAKNNTNLIAKDNQKECCACDEVSTIQQKDT